MKNKEPYTLLFEREKKRKFVRKDFLVETFLVVCFFEVKNIFSHKFEIGRLGDKKKIHLADSGNKTTFFLTLHIYFY